MESHILIHYDYVRLSFVKQTVMTLSVNSYFQMETGNCECVTIWKLLGNDTFLESVAYNILEHVMFRFQHVCNDLLSVILSNDTFLNLRPEFMETPVLKELGSVVQSSVWLEFWISFSLVLDK